ncbi:MAG: hypothetical protein ACT4PL_03705 [Phycisphaerales bacterium]
MESALHQGLKISGARYLRETLGCQAVAIEVTSPIPRHRVDIAGYTDRHTPGGESLPRPTTVFVEVKVARPDFLRDARCPDDLLRERRMREAELAAVDQEFVQVCEPHLRQRGLYLFDELHGYDFAGSASVCRRGLLRSLRRIDRLLYTHTKFFLFSRWRLADRLYLLAPEGLINPLELPTGWGLLASAGDGQIVERVPATLHTPDPRRTARTLRNIATAATSAWLPRSSGTTRAAETAKAYNPP